jgi:hypothetical protein
MLKKVTSYNTAGSFTHTFEAKRAWCRVWVTGGGASGRFQHANHAGSGGGAGGTAIGIFDITQATADIVVGAGGQQSSISGTSNVAGGDSTFTMGSDVLIGKGASQETFANNFTCKGGYDSNGNRSDIMSVRGGAGLNGQSKYTHGNTGPDCGCSFWGGGSYQATTAWPLVGAPGSGGSGSDGTSEVQNMHGKQGIVVIEEWY